MNPKPRAEVGLTGLQSGGTLGTDFNSGNFNWTFRSSDFTCCRLALSCHPKGSPGSGRLQLLFPALGCRVRRAGAPRAPGLSRALGIEIGSRKRQAGARGQVRGGSAPHPETGVTPRRPVRFPIPRLTRAPACCVHPASVCASGILRRCLCVCVPECGSDGLKRAHRFVAGPSRALAAVVAAAAASGCRPGLPGGPEGLFGCASLACGVCR